MGEHPNTDGPEFAKWCGIADEPKNTPRFLRLMRRRRRDAQAAVVEQEMHRG